LPRFCPVREPSALPAISNHGAPGLAATVLRSLGISNTRVRQIPPPTFEVAGNAGRLNAPAALCAKVKSTQASSPRSHRKTPGIPRANGFNGLLRALLGESGFLATIAGGSSRRLDISVEISGPHDFAVRLTRRSSNAPKRPPHPALNVRDDRDTPSLRSARHRESCG